jgi:hypothetical protein
LAFTLTPAEAEDFVGRKEITTELTKQLSSNNKIGFSLSGIRRIGKTSILKEVGRRLSDKKLRVVYVSVWRVSPNTIDEFVRVMNRATIKAFQDRLPAKFKFEELLVTGKAALVAFLQNLKLSAKVAEDLELTVSYVRKETDDVDAALTASFSLIEHLGEMTRSKPVLVIDEFPSIVELTYGTKNQKIGDSVIKLIRTLYEDFRQTKLVVSGSYRETMKNLVAKKRSPFYKQLLLREIESFSDSEYDEFIQHYLPGLKFANDEVEKQLFIVTSGIPYNLQLLGTEIQLQDIVHLDSEKLTKLVQTVLKKEGELSFREFVDDLSPSEVKVLKALAKAPEMKPNEIAAQQFIDKDTIGSSLSALVKSGVIERSGRGIYRFTDNLFCEWMKIIDNENL